MSRRMWMPVAKKPPKPKVPDAVKEKVAEQSRDLLEILRTQHIKAPPPDVDFSYVAEIYSKWFQNYLYFCAQYCCRAANCISPSFETKFARMEYAGPGRFNLAYMRHTGKWHEIRYDLSLDECLEAIHSEPHFMP